MTGSLWIVAGLGNPGARHAGTRHDLGAALVRRLAEAEGLRFREEEEVALAGPACLASRIEEGEAAEAEKALLALPRRYMNRSGPPLRRLLERERIGVERLVVACDDVNLPLGRIRLREAGRSGGHNGLRSILDEMGPGFPRLRLGVGGAPPGVDLRDFVLSRFAETELEDVQDMLARASALVRQVLREGRVRATTSASRIAPTGSARAGEETRRFDD